MPVRRRAPRKHEMSFRAKRGILLCPGDRGTRTRARFLTEFTLSTQGEILRYAQHESEGLGMTANFRADLVKALKCRSAIRPAFQPVVVGLRAG